MVDILLIEDSKADADLTREILNSVPIVNKLIWKQSKKEALEFLQTEDHNFGLVISDFLTNELESIDKTLISECDKWSIPVIYLTGMDDIATSIKGYSNGAIGVLEKPLRIEKFISVIKVLNMLGIRLERVNT